MIFNNSKDKKTAQSLDEYVLFPLGGIVLGLHPLEDLQKDTTLLYEFYQFSGLTISYNAKSEAEVDEVLKEVENLGGKIVKPAQRVYWGGYSGYFKDLDGYLFEVAYNPYWEFDENDNLVL